MTIPSGWGRKTLFGKANPISHPKKYMNRREIKGIRWREKKMSVRAARLLLIQGFFGCFRIAAQHYWIYKIGESSDLRDGRLVIRDSR